MSGISKWSGAGKLLDLRYLLTPVTVDWIRYSASDGLITEKSTWRSLWIFGIRIARWRVSDD